MKTTPKQIEAELREYAMRYPGVTEDFPWGERAIKINGKAFGKHGWVTATLSRRRDGRVESSPAGDLISSRA